MTKSPMPLRELGAYLKTLRPGNKPSLREMERRSGLHRNFLSQVENGQYETVRLDTLRQLAKGYGVPLETLLAKAGYVNWQDPPLPDLSVYLRTKYGLTEEGIREAERFMDYAEQRYGKTKRK